MNAETCAALTSLTVSLVRIGLPTSGARITKAMMVAPDQAHGHPEYCLVVGEIGLDLLASSEKTRKKLGWNPTGPGLIADLERLHVSDH